MKAFAPYVEQLSALTAVPPGQRDALWQSRSRAALDGQPAEALRRLVTTEAIREAGAFFTGARLSALAVREIAPTIDEHSVILDPACGTGDLLIPCAFRLAKKSRRGRTIDQWASQLVGRDLHESFVRAAQFRLALSSTVQDPHWSPPPARLLFRNIRVGCGLRDIAAIRRATHIVINPPFTHSDAPTNCKWATGKVNSAAVFLDQCVVNASPGTRIVAILPDVLRSGRRYRKWRQLISERSQIVGIRRHRRFARWADVHVFVLSLVVRPRRQRTASQPREWRWEQATGQNTVGRRFEVSVGCVVHYRDPHIGQQRAYLVSRAMPAWKTVVTIRKRRRFSGGLVKPPFVAVRRTSRPEDHYRALPIIVSGKRAVAVDNHLLVLRPKDGTLKSCKALLRLLKRRSTTAWLNRRIRCRHLTVGSLAQLPWCSA